MSWVLFGGTAIAPSGLLFDDIVIADGTFAETAGESSRRFNATGLILAPGIVDVHGDGFERNMSPRPKVHFNLDTAILETDRQLIANGITTAFLALTISWEPGLRSLSMARDVVAAMDRLRPQLSCDIRFQLRWEIFALDAVDQIEEWLSLKPTPTLAFNDHFTGMLKGERITLKLGEYAARAGLSTDEYKTLMDTIAARQTDVPAAVERLAKAAAKAGVICLAHDEGAPTVRQANRALGITVSEFPLTDETAQDAIAAGEQTILGAPNVLRGGSHVGAMNAAPAIENGLCTVLASDYYYPAQLAAVQKLAKRDDELSRYWPVIAENAARSSGLSDRGTIEAGRRADVVAFRRTEAGPVMEAVFSAGKPVFVRDAARIG